MNISPPSVKNNCSSVSHQKSRGAGGVHIPDVAIVFSQHCSFMDLNKEDHIYVLEVQLNRHLATSCLPLHMLINLSTHRFHSSVYKIDVVASQIDLVVLWEAAQIKETLSNLAEHQTLCRAWHMTI
jgi:hypothetical protein